MNNKYSDLPFTKRMKKIIMMVGSAEKLAKKAGMSAMVIGQYLSGKSDPTRKKLIALANAADVNLLWLATGKGSIHGHINIELLTLIFTIMEDHENKTGKYMSIIEKFEIIGIIYNIFYDADPVKEETGNLIKEGIAAIEGFFDSIDKLLASKKGREKVFDVLRKVFTEELGVDEIEEYLDSRILRKGLLQGIIKWPSRKIKKEGEESHKEIKLKDI